jgi:hypothetical protein
MIHHVFPAAAALALVAVLASIAPARAAGPVDMEHPIGWATMEADGTIVLEYDRTADGMFASGVDRVPPGDVDYDDVLRHLGGIGVGEWKALMPFPPPEER